MSLDLKVFDSEGLEAILESPNLSKQEVGFQSHAVLKDDGPPNIPYVPSGWPWKITVEEEPSREQRWTRESKGQGRV